MAPAALRESVAEPSATAEGATAPGISQAKGPQRPSPDLGTGSLESAAARAAAAEGVSPGLGRTGRKLSGLVTGGGGARGTVPGATLGTCTWLTRLA